MLSEEDWAQLEALRLERFRSYFAEILATCPLSLTTDNRLLILCQEPQQIDLLMADLANLKHFTYLLTAADWVVLYFAGEEIWAEPTQGLELEELSLTQSPLMVTATLEKPAAQVMNSAPQLMSIAELADDLAVITGWTIDLLKQEILAVEPQPYDYKGTLLVPMEVGDRVIDRWGDSLKQSLRDKTEPTRCTLPPAAAKTSAKKQIAKRRTPKPDSQK